MDFLELALNPRKANQRFSPFTNELPEGGAHKLAYQFGDLASVEPGELYLHSRDAASAPSTLKMLLKRDAWAVVRARTRADLQALIKFANQNFVPLVPRGSGTSSYGGAVPTEGGVVVDLRDFNRVVDVDTKAKTVRVEGNITFADLDAALAKEGLALRQYPTNYFGGTVAGWVAQGGGGVGSAKYGPFSNDLVEVTIVQPDGAVAKVTGDDLDLVYSAYGSTGFIVEVVLRVRAKTDPVPFLATFDDAKAASRAAKRFAMEAKPWSLHVHSPEYAELMNEASPKAVLPKKWSLLVVLEDDTDARLVETVKGIVQSGAGKLESDAAAAVAWNARFDHRNLKRLGPSLVVAEAVHAADRLEDAYRAVTDVVRIERQGVYWMAIAPGEFDLVYAGLEDERRATYAVSIGNAIAAIEAVKEQAGGRAYSHGVLQVYEAKNLLGADTVKKIKQFRKETDKREVFNPGPVVGARSRFMPLPVKDLGTQLKMSAPLLKSQRGMSSAGLYRGGEKADPSAIAMNRAIGRIHGGDLAEVDYDVATCLYCAQCNGVAPEREGAFHESMLPRGRVILAKGLLEGKYELTPRIHRHAAMNPLAHTPDAICPVQIPIARATDLLLGACVDEFGPLPEHAKLAESAEAELNVLGKKKDARLKWAQFPWDTEARMLFLSDDVAAYQVPEVAVASAQAILNAGLNLNHLGPKDRTSGATLMETGQREAAKAHAVAIMEECQKRNVDVIVSPDANAVRVITLDWPKWAREDDLGKAPTALHSTRAIAQYLKQKRLPLKEDAKYGKKVYYHAPEALTVEDQQAGVDILEALGADVVDAVYKDCGHGRALDTLNPTLVGAIGEDCLKHALAAGAEVVVTANAGCFQQLKTIAKKAKLELEVVDLHQLVVEHMEERAGGAAAAPAPVLEEEGPEEPELGPDDYRVEFVKEGRVLAINKNKSILEAAEEQDLELPSSCRAGSCDTCSARWEGTAPDQSAAEALTPEQQKTFVLTCIARPKGPIKIWSEEKP